MPPGKKTSISRGCKEAKQGLSVYMANYTAWSQKTKEYIFGMQEVDVHLGIEHHIPEQGIKQARKE